MQSQNLLKSPGIDSHPGKIDSFESIPRVLKCLQIQIHPPLPHFNNYAAGAKLIHTQNTE